MFGRAMDGAGGVMPGFTMPDQQQQHRQQIPQQQAGVSEPVEAAAAGNGAQKADQPTDVRQSAPPATAAVPARTDAIEPAG